MDSPFKVEQKLPLTPPPSTIKKEVSVDSDPTILPKKLLTELREEKLQKKKTRRPRLKYRPQTGSVFPLDDFLDGNAKNARDDALFLFHVLSHSKRIVCVNGAGVSVAAGIPDFRSHDGLFSTLKSKSASISSGKDLFDFNKVYSSDTMSILFNQLIKNLHHLCSTSQPTPFHHFLNSLAESGQLRRIYTQNIDGLESRFPLLRVVTHSHSKKLPLTVQLHGSIHHMCCLKCRKSYDMDPTLFKTSQDSSNGEIVPLCPECQELETVRSICGKRLQGIGKLKPNVILYNEFHPEGDIISETVNKDSKVNPDTLLIVGTSLQIPGVRQIVKQFVTKIRSKKGFIIWINNELPNQSLRNLMDGCDLFVIGDCQNIPKLMEHLK